MSQEIFSKETIKQTAVNKEKITEITDLRFAEGFGKASKKPEEADPASETAQCEASLEFIKEVESAVAEFLRQATTKKFSRAIEDYLVFPGKRAEKNFADIKDDLKQKFAEKYPQKEKELKIIFGLKENFGLNKKIAAQKERDAKSETRDFSQLAKWQGEISEFLIANRDNEEYLKYFWKIYEGMAEAADSKKEANGIKSGLLGQTEVWHLLKEAGLNPKLATPEEDAFRQTDIWLELPNQKIAVQIKKEKAAPDQPLIKSTEEITYPAILTKVEGTEYYFSTRDIEQMLRFKRNCRKLSEEKHSDVRGLYIILPRGETNPITGAPSEKMIAAFKKAIGNRIEIDRKFTPE